MNEELFGQLWDAHISPSTAEGQDIAITNGISDRLAAAFDEVRSNDEPMHTAWGE